MTDEHESVKRARAYFARTVRKTETVHHDDLPLSAERVVYGRPDGAEYVDALIAHVRDLHTAMLAARESLSADALARGIDPAALCWEERPHLGRWDLVHGDTWLGGVEVVTEGEAITVRRTTAAPERRDEG